MKIDLTCPLEMRSYQLTHYDSMNTSAEVKFLNLVAHRISTFEATLVWIDDESGDTACVPTRAADMRAGARNEFMLCFSTDAVFRPTRLEISFTRVEFEDGTPCWTQGNAPLYEISELTPESGLSRKLLSQSAGADAERFASDMGDTWICVCGRLNARHTEVCARCMRKKSDVLQHMTRETILSPASLTIPVPEVEEIVPPTEPLQPIAETSTPTAPAAPAFTRMRRQRSLLIRRTLTMLIIATLLAAVGYLSGRQADIETARRGAIPPVPTVQNIP